MSDLQNTLVKFVQLFDRLQAPHAIMGGWAVRHLRYWAQALGVSGKLEEVLATSP